MAAVGFCRVSRAVTCPKTHASCRICDRPALDDNADLRELIDYSTYGVFDARELPNLMALLERQGVDDFEPRINPIRCNR